MKKNEIVLEEWKKDEIFDLQERIIAKKKEDNVLIFREIKMPANNPQSASWKYSTDNRIPIEWATKIHKVWGKK